MEIDLEKLLVIGVNSDSVLIEEKLPPATLQQVVNFERKIGGSLPEDYRKFLLLVNGGGVNYNMVTDGLVYNVEPLISGSAGQYKGEVELRYLYPLYDGPPEVQGVNLASLNLDLHYNEFKALEVEEVFEFVPPHCIPIADAHGSATLLLAIDGPYHNKVLYWRYNSMTDQMYGNVSLAANSFTEFVASLKPA